MPAVKSRSLIKLRLKRDYSLDEMRQAGLRIIRRIDNIIEFIKKLRKEVNYDGLKRI